MAMITIFTVPKGFDGAAAGAQANAIRSWTRLRDCEVILVGDDPGVRAFAASNGARHLPHVDTSDAGVPLLSSAFDAVKTDAAHDVLAFVNTDIILTRNFVDTVRRVRAWRPRVLITGRRINLDIREAIDFSPGWEDALHARTRESGDLHPGHDYFVFPKRLWTSLPPFVVGHEYWSAWMTYSARTRKAAVVDATEAISAIHQVHASNPARSKSADWQRNRILMGGPEHSFLPSEATHAVSARGIQSICRSCYPVCACQFGG